MTSQSSALERALRRDRVVVVVAIMIIAAIAWAYTVYLAGGGMRGVGAGMAMGDGRSWGGADFGLMFGMWAVMMVAMMTPSAAPMVIMFAAVNRKRRERDAPYVPVGVFLGGYVVVWCGFSLVATTGNWGLHQASLLTSMMGSASSGYLGGALLIIAGVFQWSPLKSVCLRQCRTPMGFLMTSWREGRVGALRMGLEHGAFCLGCCWALMLLLFALGVMNLVWIAALAAFVLAEKVAPVGGEGFSRVAGALLAVWGVWVVVNAAL